jgi:hypothetical protein
MSHRLLLAFLSALLLVPALVDPSAAQKKKSETPPAATNGAAATIPSDVALNILIRRVLLTVNDANMSGNYTVLHDLAAPGFQAKNDPTKLTKSFADLRASNIDFAPILYFAPKLIQKPAFTEGGRLRLKGFVPTRPQQINFDMVFEHNKGRWRLDGIAVSTTPAKAATAKAGGNGKKANAKSK